MQCTYDIFCIRSYEVIRNKSKRPVFGGFVPTSVVEDGALATDALFAPFLKEKIKKIQERFCQKYFALEKIKKMPERLLQTLC